MPVHIGVETCRTGRCGWNVDRISAEARGRGLQSPMIKACIVLDRAALTAIHCCEDGADRKRYRWQIRGRGEEGRSLGSSSVDCEHFYRWGTLFPLVLCSAPSVLQPVFTITEKAPTRAFSWLKAPTSSFTFKTLLRHYAKQALTPR